MSKKNYVRIAEILRIAIESCETSGEEFIIIRTMSHFADYFKGDNPRFDRDTFLRAARHPNYLEVSADVAL